MFRHILGEMGLINLLQSTTIYNDNAGAVTWSNSTSTKGMRHVNIRENCIREAIHCNEISVILIAGAANPSDSYATRLLVLLFFSDSVKCDCSLGWGVSRVFRGVIQCLLHTAALFCFL